MKKVCAWCNKLLGFVAGNSSEELISHGICPECSDNLDFQLGVDLERYINSLPAAIVMVDGNCKIITANRLAADLLCLELPDHQEHYLGKIFECAYARLPEGCGRTMHCNGCTLRAMVQEASNTGQSQLRVPALLNRSSSDPEARPDCYISIRKENKLVLLQIEPATAG